MYIEEYQKFIESKRKSHEECGFDIEDSNLKSSLFDFQKFIVKRALKNGKYAIFADCGLGKTAMQLEWARQVYLHTKKPVLILAPLAVSGQTINEGLKFGIDVIKYDGGNAPIQITNYEQIEKLDCSIFSGVVLDESSILKNFDGKTKKLIIDKFSSTHFKLACTATPSPNDPIEICNHAEFLDVMQRSEMLAMYFLHDGGETSKWRLKGHAESVFYKFIGTWAVMLAKPHDIGFASDGYNLPDLNLIDHVIKTDKKDNGRLFNDSNISALTFNAELRETMNERLSKTAEIANDSNENFIIWIKQNAEGELLKKMIPDAVEVKGSDSPDYKERMLIGFANNEFRVLITKTKIAQFGLNYQNCANQIFASLDFSFEGLYQAIRRSYRFGQKSSVNIHIVTTDSMQNVSASIKNKQANFETMQAQMSNAAMSDFTRELPKPTIKKETIHDLYTIKNGDCVSLIESVESESVGLSVFSPPFADLYTYSNHVEDMGNSKDYKEFLAQFKFLVNQLFRVMKSGRNVCVHCMDLPIQKGKEGYIGLRDFSGMIRDSFEDAGFIYHSRITIWKDPVIEMQRTKALGLLHKQVKKDSTMSRVGIPDYVMIFRKDGDRNDPVMNTDLTVDQWQKIASPVWYDINYSKTLQGMRDARDEEDEKHICPLQLDTIERLILLFSNKGDTVLTPFLGIGSEVYQAVKMDRKAIGFELKESYFDVADKNIKIALKEKSQMSIF